jgi:adenosylhomocysteine nucleosidase
MADHVAAALAGGLEEIVAGIRSAAILFPLRLEAGPFLKRLGYAEKAAVGRLSAWRSKLHANDVLIVQTGVGRRQSVAALEALLALGSIDTVISAGFAGALAPELEVGDVIAATDVIDEKMASINATWQPRGLRQGRILTTARVVGDPAEKRHLHGRFQACAVDMESAFIGQRCAERGIQFGVVRAITDDVETSIAPAVARLVSDERGSIISGLLGMARQPLGALRDLLRLRRNALIASERLAQALCRALQGTAS